MRINIYKRNEYKFLPEEILREIYLKKKKDISILSSIIIVIPLIVLILCGFIGWTNIFITLYAGINLADTIYFFTVIFCLLFIVIGSIIKTESKIAIKICFILFCLLSVFGGIATIFTQDSDQSIIYIFYIIFAIVGILILYKLSCFFKDMDELRKIDGYPRFLSYKIEDSDLETKRKK